MEEGQRRQDARQVAPEARERVGDGGWRRQAVGAAADRLLQRRHPQGEEQAGETDGEERRLPADQPERPAAGEVRVPRLDDDGADQQRDAAAEVEAARINRQRRRPPLAREPVGQHRERRRTRRCLADADADACRAQLDEARRQARQHGHPRPDGEAEAEQPRPHPVVGEPPERDAEQRVEHGKGGAVEEAELGVGQMEVVLDVLGQDRQDLPVDEVDRIDEHEQSEDVARVGAAERRRIAGDGGRFAGRRQGSLPGRRSRRCDRG